MQKININDYNLLDIDYINVVENDIISYDIEVEDDNSYYISHDNNLILTHNCDGNHIKGLLINFFEYFFPELLDLNFLFEFVTPIIKAQYKKDIKYFYKLNDYNEWKTTQNSIKYKIKYFKGLGTLEPNEAKKFFKDINKHLIKFNYDKSDETKNIIDLVFNKKRAEDRKKWLLDYVPGNIVDKFSEKTTYESFFNKEFIEFSMYDNIRSIPNIMDGLKPSQRKILYGCIKKNITNEIKVSQLSGTIIEQTSYHHGNVSLEQTMVGMAQNFVGSNNINLLVPNGQFGTRLKGGKDAASARYIFTQLNDLTRKIYKIDDDNILNYLDDDGYPIEPEFYVPILPMILVNGTEGIGTGWSTDVPKYNPKELIKYIGCKLKKQKTPIIEPYYNKFSGTISYDEENGRWSSRGIIKKVNMSTLRITELPIGMWNNKYYDILDKLIDKKVIKDYKKQDTDEKVDISINVQREQMKDLESKNFYKELSLETNISCNNMHLFNHLGQIKKYNTIYDIIDEYYDIRFEYYQKRKDYILDKLKHDRMILINKMKFINAILKGDVILNKAKREDIENKLEELEIEKTENSYNYLLNMTLISLTTEKLSELKEQYTRKKEEIDILKTTSIEKLWLTDLGELYKKIK